MLAPSTRNTYQLLKQNGHAGVWLQVRGVFAWMRQRLEAVARTTEMDEEEYDLPHASWRQVGAFAVAHTAMLLMTLLL